ncbi:MAG: hypothetical protein ACJAT7_003609 [Psychromonas sp.]|jgi:hypothetical protein
MLGKKWRGFKEVIINAGVVWAKVIISTGLAAMIRPFSFPMVDFLVI